MKILSLKFDQIQDQFWILKAWVLFWTKNWITPSNLNERRKRLSVIKIEDHLHREFLIHEMKSIWMKFDQSRKFLDEFKEESLCLTTKICNSNPDLPQEWQKRNQRWAQENLLSKKMKNQLLLERRARI